MPDRPRHKGAVGAIVLLLAVVVAAAAAGPAPAAAQSAERSPTLGEIMVLNRPAPGLCAALAAGLAQQAVDVFQPDRDPALAGLAFLEAPAATAAALGCDMAAVNAVLSCIVDEYAARRRALLAGTATVQEGRVAILTRARTCAEAMPQD